VNQLERILSQFWVQGPGREGPDAWRRRWSEEWLEAAAQAGAVDEATVALWQQRFATAASDDGAPVSAFADRARDVLDGLLAALPAEIALDDPRWTQLQATLMALTGLKLAGVPTARDLMPEFASRLVYDAPPVDEATLAAHKRFLEAVAPTEQHSPEVVRIVPGPAGPTGGLTVTSLEISHGRTTVCWLWPRSRRSAPRSIIDELALSDDVGTGYLTVGAGSGSFADGATHGENHFLPAPPPRARRLRVTWRRHDVHLTL